MLQFCCVAYFTDFLRKKWVLRCQCCGQEPLIFAMSVSLRWSCSYFLHLNIIVNASHWRKLWFLAVMLRRPWKNTCTQLGSLTESWERLHAEVCHHPSHSRVRISCCWAQRNLLPFWRLSRLWRPPAAVGGACQPGFYCTCCFSQSNLVKPKEFFVIENDHGVILWGRNI